MPYETLALGMQWKNIYECRRYLRRYAVKKRFEIKFLKNDLQRVRGKCVTPGCPWYMFASRMRRQLTFRMNTLVDEHNCLHLAKTRNKMADCRFVAEELEDSIRAHKQKNYKPSFIIEDFWKEFMLHISYWVAWRAKGVALERIYGSYDESYRLAPEMCRQLLEANPRSIASVSRHPVHKGDYLRWLVWGTAKAYQMSDYKRWADQLKKADPEAYTWLHSKAKVETWARSHFDKQAKCEHITNNFSESFNKWILELREMPVCVLVDKFHLMMMTLMHERRTKARTWNINGLVPRAQRMIQQHVANTRHYKVQGSSDHLYSVGLHNSSNRWTVNLDSWTCSCCVWDITGIQCVHAVAVLYVTQRAPEQFCHDYHKVKTYLHAYNGYITPMAQPQDWSEAGWETSKTKEEV
ncbi:zinc finger protein [Macleaya cordata]|uniref:Zinc finger protein n=1 Tax=Macleaya cordata TaxID=56857 RepID=A0A200R0A5_MACCD|nr:zinc finger protein [Macleaya cordata]